MSLGLVLTIVAIYAPVAQHQFLVFDDAEYVTDNPAVRMGLSWDGVRWAFTHAHSANWHPLTWLSHMADAQVHGLVAGRHALGNVALHAANAVLVLLVLRSLTGALVPSAVVAAIFAVHPLRVESVAWVSERKDVLCAFFGLLALLAWTSWIHRGGAWRYGAALAAFAAGLLAKPMLVTFPFVLLLLDAWPLRRLGARGPGLARLVTEKLPWIGLAAAVSLVTVAVQREAGAVVGMEALPLGWRLRNAVAAYAAYLRLTVWPSGLAAFYPLDADVSWVGPLVLLTVISGLVVVLARRAPHLAVGWLWYLGMLVPVIGIVKAGEQAMADRFTYLPGLGLAIAAVWALRDVVTHRPAWRPVLGVATAALLVGWSVASRQQVHVWHDGETLFRHALDVTKDNYVAHLNLGATLFLRGVVDEAAHHFEEVVRLRPSWGRAHANLGRVALARGDRGTARAEYEAAVRLAPDDPLGHYNLGLLLVEAGDLEGGIAAYRRALAADPDHAKAWTNLGWALGRQGHTEEAIASYREALARAPDLAPAHNNLAVALESLGQRDEALHHYAEGVRLAPDDPRGRFNLAVVLLDAGRAAEAAEQFAIVARSMPDSPDVQAGLAQARAAAASRAGEGHR